MARQIPEDRFEKLVEHATEVFIARGFRHTQMAEIAEAVGVSKGTLYVYVESKEALFALCLLQSSRTRPVAVPSELPISTPRQGDLSTFLKNAVARETQKSLMDALEKPRADDIHRELDVIFRELYETLERNCRGIKLLDRCSDHPEVDGAWNVLGRRAYNDHLVAYLESRIAAGQIPRHTDPGLSMRISLEICTTWAVHIKWDRNPQSFDPIRTKGTVIEFAIEGLLNPVQASP
ncbi:MAG: TetR/AcrR family transcriptional regulator [bacterium]|nr:TetR/AcrR family transcriptional regulator [bacterium]